MSHLKVTLPAAILLGGFLVCSTASFGKPEYTKATKKACAYCHVDSKATPKELTEAGKCYSLAKCWALEQEVQSLKADLAALRAQIQQGGSAQAPVGSGSGSKPDGARPSETEIRACVAAAPTQTDGTYGFISGQIEFGTVITSQGGMMELGMGAPKGTSIFPIRINANNGFVWEFWAFKDSFGKLKCIRH